MSKIKIENLAVAYNIEPVIWDINIEIEAGKMTAIVGPNGAGKSTLFKTILSFQKLLTGKITIAGETTISYVPQLTSVDWDFPTTVFDVVLMGRYKKFKLFNRVTKHDKQVVLEALKKVQLLEFADRQINDLSGGQKQRVFLARALVQESDLYLLDEPFQGIDANSEKVIVNILKALKEEGKTIVIVHHNLQTVEEYFDNVVLINKNIIAAGKVSEVFTEENIKLTYKTSGITLQKKGEDNDNFIE